MSLKDALRTTIAMAGDEDDNGEPNPPTGDGDDGRQYDA